MEIYANFYLVVCAAACMSKICVLIGVCLMEVMCWRRMIAIFDEFSCESSGFVLHALTTGQPSLTSAHFARTSFS